MTRENDNVIRMVETKQQHIIEHSEHSNRPRIPKPMDSSSGKPLEVSNVTTSGDSGSNDSKSVS